MREGYLAYLKVIHAPQAMKLAANRSEVKTLQLQMNVGIRE